MAAFVFYSKMIGIVKTHTPPATAPTTVVDFVKNTGRSNSATGTYVGNTMHVLK